MNLYTEISENDKVKIVDFGNLPEFPENTELHVTNRKFQQTFITYKHIQIINEAGRWSGRTEHALFDTEDPRYTAHNGVDLVYYKRIDLVTWDDTELPYSYEITTDAEDTYVPYDGVPDIPADGTSSCTITVTEKDYKGDIVTNSSTVVVFKASRGSLSSLQETMVNGVAEVNLTSVAETTIATVEVEIDGEVFSTIDIQFAPGS